MARLLVPRRPGWSRPTVRSVTGTSDRTLPLKVSASSSNPVRPEMTTRPCPARGWRRDTAFAVGVAAGVDRSHFDTAVEVVHLHAQVVQQPPGFVWIADVWDRGLVRNYLPFQRIRAKPTTRPGVTVRPSAESRDRLRDKLE